MKDKEAMRLALEVLYPIAHNTTDDPRGQAYKAITALKERLADPMREVQRLGQEIEQEPVAFLANGARFKLSMDDEGKVNCFWNQKELDGRWVALVAAEDDCHLNLTHPPQRTEQEPQDWKTPPKDDAPLVKWAKEQTIPPQRKPLTDDQIYEMYNEPRSDAEMLVFARAIEAAHGIKENT
jgi:hypothetical protein